MWLLQNWFCFDNIGNLEGCGINLIVQFWWKQSQLYKTERFMSHNHFWWIKYNNTIFNSHHCYAKLPKTRFRISKTFRKGENQKKNRIKIINVVLKKRLSLFINDNSPCVYTKQRFLARCGCRETRVYHAVRKALNHTQKYYPNSSFAGKGFMSCQAD